MYQFSGPGHKNKDRDVSSTVKRVVVMISSMTSLVIIVLWFHKVGND